MLVHLNNPARSVPLVEMGTSLVLNAYKVPHFEGREAFGVLSPNLSSADVALAEGLLSCCQCLAPHCLGPVSPRGDRDAVPHWSAKDAHGRKDFRVRVWRLALVQYRPPHRVRVQFTFRTCVVCDEPLHRLDTDYDLAVIVVHTHLCRKDLVLAVVNSGPPSEASYSGVPYVAKA